MIIARAPLRISIGGGGTDLPSYYEQFGSTFMSAAINKYIYISIHKNFKSEMILRYSHLEKVARVEDIQHPIIRECLKEMRVDAPLEISSFADVPSGTGLGSSGAFTVSLIRALATWKRVSMAPEAVAELACHIEMEKLGHPVGKQDQFISAIGGVSKFTVEKNGKVHVDSFSLNQSTLVEMEERLMLYFTGFSRSANVLLEEQRSRTLQDTSELSREMKEGLHFVKELGIEIERVLLAGDVLGFGRLMDTHWRSKKKRSIGMSNSEIDDCYEFALQNGAVGGKVIGAGGGGFLLFCAEDRWKLRKALKARNLYEVPFRFDHLGVQTLLRDEA